MAFYLVSFGFALYVIFLAIDRPCFALYVIFLAIDRPWTGALTSGGSRRPCV